MDRFAYLLLGLSLLAVWSLIYVTRRDLQRMMMRVSIVGAFAGILSEYWYFRDYWRPPLAIHWGNISLDDAIFGFAITGISASIVLWLTKKKSVQVTSGHPKIFLGLFCICLALLILLCDVLHLQSIFVTSGLFLFCTVVMISMRPDLLKLSILSGCITALLIAPIYVVLSALFPGYWQQYWLLAGTSVGGLLAPGIPGTEILWYFSWGAFAGIASHFARGTAPR